MTTLMCGKTVTNHSGKAQCDRLASCRFRPKDGGDWQYRCTRDAKNIDSAFYELERLERKPS